VVVQKGVAILQTIANIGLVLAPEVVQWNIPLANGTTKQIRHRQTRICFTELSRPELPDHARKFGPFSLEFSLGTLRESAVLPVIYMPQNIGGERNMSSAGAMMVWMFEMVRYTLEQLEQLKTLSSLQSSPERPVAENYTLNLQNQNDENLIDRQFTVEARIVRGVLDYLGYKNAPFELMRGAVQVAQALFYPTDDAIHDQQLAYYRQREWRMIPGFAAGGVGNSRTLSDPEKNTLAEIDPNFWLRELQDDKGRFRRIDEAHVIEKLGGLPIKSVVNAVLVPPRAYDDAVACFGDRVQVIDGMMADRTER
jgi:hypothetical protein